MYILAKGNSMLPTLKSGKLYKIDNSLNDTISVGDIIVFNVKDLVICHRVIKVINAKNKEVFFKTQGDNCEKPDPYAVTQDMIIGRINL